MPREYYSVSEAAKTLGISVDTLRRWDRQGRIKAERDRATAGSCQQARSTACAASRARHA